MDYNQGFVLCGLIQRTLDFEILFTLPCVCQAFNGVILRDVNLRHRQLPNIISSFNY